MFFLDYAVLVMNSYFYLKKRKNGAVLVVVPGVAGNVQYAT